MAMTVEQFIAFSRTWDVTVGRAVQTRNGKHHGRITRIGKRGDVFVTHDDDCCEPRTVSEMSVEVTREWWMPVRTTSWARILKDD